MPNSLPAGAEVDARGPAFFRWRYALKLSQADLIGLLPFSRSSIQDFERGCRLHPPYKIPERSWQRLLDSCLRVQTGMHMSREFEVRHFKPDIGVHSRKELVRMKVRNKRPRKAA